MGNLKIATRLYAGFGGLVVLFALVVSAALMQMATMRASAFAVDTIWLPSVEKVNLLNTAIADYRNAEMQHVLNTEEAVKGGLEKKMETIQARIKELRAWYEKHMVGNEAKALYQEFAAAREAYLNTHKALITVSRTNDLLGASELLQGESEKLYERSSDILDKLVALSHDGSVAAAKTAEDAYVSGRNMMVGAMLLGLLIAVVAATYITRSITQPLSEALHVAGNVAAGDLTAQIQNSSRDEIGQLLQAMKAMQESLVSVVSNVRSGSESVATASAEIAQGNHDLSARTEQQ
ncbi:MAG: HAMP domain-containing protein, partial [Curvibacter sp.]